MTELAFLVLFLILMSVFVGAIYELSQLKLNGRGKLLVVILQGIVAVPLVYLTWLSFYFIAYSLSP